MNIIFKTLIDKKLEIYLQPILNSVTNKFTIFEVLSRVTIDNNVYSPPIFLKDQNHKHLEYLTLKMLEQVSAIIPLFPAEVKFSVNINLNDLKSPEIMTKLQKINQHIIIEILEHDFNFHKQIKILQELKEQNFLIALDDLGSSFSLANFFEDTLGNYNIFDIIKFDKKITGALENKKNFIFIESLLKIIHTNQQKVVAEYICDRNTKVLAKQLGVDYLQGFYLEKALPVYMILKKYFTSSEFLDYKAIVSFEIQVLRQDKKAI